MKFQAKFTRFLGGGGTVLGSDALPVDGSGNPIKPGSSVDNLISSRACSINGWPLTRLVLVAKYTGAGVPIAINCAMYTFEDQLGMYIPLVQSATTITPAKSNAQAATMMVYFDPISLIDMNKPAATDPNAYQAYGGNSDYVCIISNIGASPNGQYDFALAAELSGKPF